MAYRVILLLASLLVVAACSNESSPSQGEITTYTSRGKVVEVVGRQVTIHHEAIPQFASADGQAVGMPSHAMSFLAADGVALDDIAAGDAVEFAFDVWWQPLPGYELTQVTPLPDDTELDLAGNDLNDHDSHDGHAH